MRQRDGEVVGERGLYARRGSGDEAESTACGAADAVAAAEVEIKLPPCEGDGWDGRAIGQPSTAQAAGLEFHLSRSPSRLFATHTACQQVHLLGELSVFDSLRENTISRSSRRIHTVSVSQTWIVYRKTAKHFEHVKPP